MRHCLVFVCLLFCGHIFAADPPRLDAFGDPLPLGATQRLGTARVAVNSVFFRPIFAVDSMRVFTRDSTGLPIAKDLMTGRTLFRTPVRYSEKPPLAVSGDGRRAVSHTGRTIEVWDVETGRTIREIAKELPTGFRELEIEATFSADGALLAVVKREGVNVRSFGKLPPKKDPNSEISVWQLEKETPLKRISFPKLANIALSGDGKTYATSVGGLVQIWDTATSKEVTKFQTTSETVRLVLSADGRMMAQNNKDVIELWDTQTGKAGSRLEGNPDWSEWMRFSPDGKILVSFGPSLTVWRWTVADGRLTETTKCPTG